MAKRAKSARKSRNRLLSVVVPVFDEAETLDAFVGRLFPVLDGLEDEVEVVFVDDGSADGTGRILADLSETRKNVSVLTFSRNFGKEIALTAGLDHAKGDVVAVIDADLQDPPELIPELLAELDEGYDMVAARRSMRHGESWLKKFTAAAFYRLMEHVGPVSMPRDVGDFRIMTRDAAIAVCRLREHHRFMKGLFAWVGFRQKTHSFERDARFAGGTKWGYWRLWNLSLEGITSFTFAPLRLSTYIGLASAAAAFVYAGYFIVKTLLFGDPVAGFPTLIVVILFLGGIQLMVLGIIGEYLGRIFNETKGRPLYLAREFHESAYSRPTIGDQIGHAEGAVRRTNGNHEGIS